MKSLHLLPIGEVADGLLPFLQSRLAAALRIPCKIVPAVLDPAPTFHGDRRQYHSSQILTRMQNYVSDDCWRVLGVAEVDLYISILTFVFGEAQMGGPCALVSTKRLRQEFYSLPPDIEMLRQRLLKEAIHEIGHTCDLTHCNNYACVMASSHAVEWIDLKDAALCPGCQRQMASKVR
jgi:archaemetzincin